MVSSSVTSSSPVVGACTVTCALSVAKLTVAVTPGRRVKRFSTRATHEEHVIPETARSSSTTGSAAGAKEAGATAGLVINQLPHILLHPLLLRERRPECGLRWCAGRAVVHLLARADCRSRQG